VTSLRTLLVLGRVSNLPTVWSNCLAGWWLGGGGNLNKLPFLFIGTTLLYIGGMFLNDAFDAEFDRQHRRERPIPSGAASVQCVWRSGFALLLFGNALLFFAGVWPGIFGAALAILILLYDSLHKEFVFAPVIMGACRLMVYVVAAASGVLSVTGYALWGGVALGVYVVGVSFVARREVSMDRPPRWPVVLLAVPLLLALAINDGEYRESAALLALVPALWILRSLRSAYFSPMPNVGRTVSGLLAGIVFVDWLAVANSPRELGAIFIGLFLAALLAQRFVPAT
jgi:hypothetical protein